MTKLHSRSFRKPLFRISPVFDRSQYRVTGTEYSSIRDQYYPIRDFSAGQKRTSNRKKVIFVAGKKNRNDRENRILFIRLAGTDDRNALPPATSGAIRLRRRFRRQPDAARSASGKERPALFPPFVHRVRNRKRGHRTDAAYKLQTTRISDSFSPAFGKKSAPLQQSSGESPSRRGGLLRLFAGQNPDLTASIAPMRIFRPKRRTTLV